MDRKEAQEHIGQHVYAWTSMNGTYLGILREVVVRKGKPWRGKVEVVGPWSNPGASGIEADAPFGHRKGFAKGQVINIGGSSIKIATQDPTSGKWHRN